MTMKVYHIITLLGLLRSGSSETVFQDPGTIYQREIILYEYDPRNLTVGDVQFTLHTRRNASGELIRAFRDVPKINTVLLIAGWRQDTMARHSYFRIFTNVYLKEKNINVIEVHADKALWYPSVKYVNQLGELVGDFLVTLGNRVGLNKIHIVGVGVGSHVAGIAAHYANARSRKKLERITALSPSRTSYPHGLSFRQLTSADARYVDVYVTSQSGLQEPIGNLTYYPNGGASQPLCQLCSYGSDQCNEMRSVWLYIYTIGLEIAGTICDTYANYLSNSCLDRHPWYGDSYGGHVVGKAYIWMYCWAPKKCKFAE